MATYLITGGCGFIGSHLVRRLIADGHNVRVLDDLSSGRRENIPGAVPIIVKSVEDSETVAEAVHGVDGCFHLAAVASVERSRTEWPMTHRVNQGGTINLFNAAAKREASGILPIVYASSAAIYGDNTDTPLAESARPAPISAYGADKLGCELHARVAGLVHRVPTIGFRFFNVFGPRQDPHSPYSGVISTFAHRLIRDEPLIVYGDGEQSRDFVYVTDVVDYLLAGMAHANVSAPVLNVCTGQSTTVNGLIEAMGRVLGVMPGIMPAPARYGDIQTSLGDPAEARLMLGCRADTSLEEGLSHTLSWMKEQV